MAKVRVPIEHRPPERYGKYRYEWNDVILQVAGVYRLPKEGEYYWSWLFKKASCAAFDFTEEKMVILERVK